MRIGRIGALVLTMALAIIVPGGGAAAVSTPSGISIDCGATPMNSAPYKEGGLLYGSGSGTCTLSGGLGGSWELRVLVRLQVKVDGTWRTRAVAIGSIQNAAATKRIRRLTVGHDCTSTVLRPWRARVTVELRINEKTSNLIESGSEVSAVGQRRC